MRSPAALTSAQRAALMGIARDTWRALGAPDWPDREAWLKLRAADRLEAAEPSRAVLARGGELELELDLPMPGVALLSLAPA